jgi:hypothetical protein
VHEIVHGLTRHAVADLRITQYPGQGRLFPSSGVTARAPVEAIMDWRPIVAATWVSGTVWLAVAVLWYRSHRRATHHKPQPTQSKDILVKCIELHPKPRHIPTDYETSWTQESKTKTFERARPDVDELDCFNLDGGLFFSQDRPACQTG